MKYKYYRYKYRLKATDYTIFRITPAWELECKKHGEWCFCGYTVKDSIEKHFEEITDNKELFLALL